MPAYVLYALRILTQCLVRAGTLGGGVVTGTMDLDQTWVHENGPGALICPGLTQVCYHAVPYICPGTLALIQLVVWGVCWSHTLLYICAGFPVFQVVRNMQYARRRLGLI